MISAGQELHDPKLVFALRMGQTARRWKSSAAKLAKSAGHKGYSLLPLYHLAANPSGLTQTELARRMTLTESSMARLVQDLIHDRLVRRIPMPGDGRAWLILIEPIGTQTMLSFEPYAKAFRDRILEGVEGDELIIMNRFLLLLIERLDYERDGR